MVAEAADITARQNHEMDSNNGKALGAAVVTVPNISKKKQITTSGNILRNIFLLLLSIGNPE